MSRIEQAISMPEIDRAAGVHEEGGEWICDTDGGKIVGKLSPYRVPPQMIGMTQLPARIKYWLRCENDHWCLAVDPINDEELNISIQRGQVKAENTVALGNVPAGYEDLFPKLRMYENADIPTNNSNTEWSRDFVVNSIFDPLVAQLVGCMRAQKNGKNLTDAQILGLKRKFRNELRKPNLTDGERSHWKAVLNRKLAGNGLRTTDFWEDVQIP